MTASQGAIQEITLSFLTGVESPLTDYAGEALHVEYMTTSLSHHLQILV